MPRAWLPGSRPTLRPRSTRRVRLTQAQGGGLLPLAGRRLHPLLLRLGPPSESGPSPSVDSPTALRSCWPISRSVRRKRTARPRACRPNPPSRPSQSSPRPPRPRPARSQPRPRSHPRPSLHSPRSRPLSCLDRPKPLPRLRRRLPRRPLPPLPKEPTVQRRAPPRRRPLLAQGTRSTALSLCLQPSKLCRRSPRGAPCSRLRRTMWLSRWEARPLVLTLSLR